MDSNTPGIIDAPVTYWPDFAASFGDPDAMFAELLVLPWDRRPNVPRDELYFNDTDVAYTYGAGEHARTYEPSLDWPAAVTASRLELEARLGTSLDVCFLNLYKDARDQLGQHSDDSPEMDPERPIVTVSFGAVREIRFQTIENRAAVRAGLAKPHIETLTLGHGSAAIMAPGMQQTWLHSIPKSGQSHIGPRISETFRGYIAPPAT